MKELKFNYDGKDYRLAYSRESVRSLESQGFNIDALQQMPVTMIPMLFYGAFQVNHKGIKRRLVNEIYEALDNKTDLVFALAELYYETVNSLLEDEEAEESTKKISWTMDN